MECDDCGTITLIDNSDPKCLEPFTKECPVCVAKKNWPWGMFLLKERQTTEGLEELVKIHRKIGQI